MHLEHGDIVVSANNNGMSVEAYVDFEQGDKVYISEWGKNLNNPIRYIVPKEKLYKKDKNKLVISLQEMNALMASVMNLTSASYDKEPSIDDLQIGQQLVNEGRIYKYVGNMDGEPVRDCDGYFCVIDKEDIKNLFRTREQVCQKLFGLGEKDIVVE